MPTGEIRSEDEYLAGLQSGNQFRKYALYANRAAAQTATRVVQW